MPLSARYVTLGRQRRRALRGPRWRPGGRHPHGADAMRRRGRGPAPAAGIRARPAPSRDDDRAQRWSTTTSRQRWPPRSRELAIPDARSGAIAIERGVGRGPGDQSACAAAAGGRRVLVAGGLHYELGRLSSPRGTRPAPSPHFKRRPPREPRVHAGCRRARRRLSRGRGHREAVQVVGARGRGPARPAAAVPHRAA